MKRLIICTMLTAAPAVLAQNLLEMGKQAAGKAAVGGVEKRVNAKLLEEGRKNQCSFKTDSDKFQGNCAQKLKNLTKALVDAKKALNEAGVKNYKFVVSGHTDSRGDPGHNKELSQKRAAVIVRELVSRGVTESEIIALGLGSEKPAVKPDDTEPKRAKNRRYEVQVQL